MDNFQSIYLQFFFKNYSFKQVGLIWSVFSFMGSLSPKSEVSIYACAILSSCSNLLSKVSAYKKPKSDFIWVDFDILSYSTMSLQNSLCAPPLHDSVLSFLVVLFLLIIQPTNLFFLFDFREHQLPLPSNNKIQVCYTVIERIFSAYSTATVVEYVERASFCNLESDN